MSTPHYDPKVEEKALSMTINHLQEQWGTRQMLQAVLALCDAVAHAEHMLAIQDLPQDPEQRKDQSHRGAGLRALLRYAQEVLQKGEPLALLALARRREHEPRPGRAWWAVFTAGTILSCPSCGEGLHKVAAPATTVDLVLDDGTFLRPLNCTIPPRRMWEPLACPFCGGRLLQEGKIHTFQQGWR
jgi:hypothetical protein